MLIFLKDSKDESIVYVRSFGGFAIESTVLKEAKALSEALDKDDLPHEKVGYVLAQPCLFLMVSMVSVAALMCCTVPAACVPDVQNVPVEHQARCGRLSISSDFRRHSECL